MRMDLKAFSLVFGFQQTCSTEACLEPGPVKFPQLFTFRVGGFTKLFVFSSESKNLTVVDDMSCPSVLENNARL